MKAIYQTEYGKSEVLKYGDQTAPKIKENELRIQNFASSVNPRDWLIRSGRYQLQFLVPAFPLILGSDFAGIVLEVGNKVKDFKSGDRVFGMKNPSAGLASYADEVAVSETSVALIPESLSFNEAAGLPLCALTAWQALVNKANIKPELKTLIIGGSGGVGCYAIQIATALGSEVSAVCSGANHDMVMRLGAKKVIDYKQEDFLEAGINYDIIFDTIGRHSLSRCESVLKAGGVYVSTVPTSKNLKDMFVTGLKSLFSQSTKRAQVVMVKSEGLDLQQIALLISEGKIQPVIDQVFPIQKASLAHDYSRSMRAKGKIILEIQKATGSLK